LICILLVSIVALHTVANGIEHVADARGGGRRRAWWRRPRRRRFPGGGGGVSAAVAAFEAAWPWFRSRRRCVVRGAVAEAGLWPPVSAYGVA